ncbi:unnamed protein product, partial [Effrenium voratum]
MTGWPKDGELARRPGLYPGLRAPAAGGLARRGRAFPVPRPAPALPRGCGRQVRVLLLRQRAPGAAPGHVGGGAGGPVRVAANPRGDTGATVDSLAVGIPWCGLPGGAAPQQRRVG